MDGARYFSFEIINICDNFCVEHLFMFSHFSYKFVDFGDAQFIKAIFIS